MRRRMYQSNLHDLFYSLIHGGLSALDQYIANGGSIKIKGPDRKSLLIGAIDEKQECVFHRCLELGIDVDAADDIGRTGLLWASKEGLINYVETLLAHGSCVNKTDVEGKTALMLATQGNHLDVMRMLVDAGSDVNIEDSDGFTALHFSSLHMRQECLEFLLESGSNTFLRTSYGDSPISLALANRDLKSVQKILNRNGRSCEGSVYSPDLQTAVEKKYFDAVQMLLSYGVDPFPTEDCLVWADILRSSSRRMRETLISEYGYFTSSGPENKLVMYIFKNHLFLRYILLLKLLFQYGFQAIGVMKVMTCKEKCMCRKVIADIQKTTGHVVPGTLQVLCRNRVRRCLAYGVVKKVDSLPIPHKLKRYLCMSSEYSLEESLI